MTKSAYINLVKGSNQDEITLQEVKELLNYYKEMVSKTGAQLDWDYESRAFPYFISEKEQEGLTFLQLSSLDNHLYKGLIIGVGKKEDGTNFVQIVLPNQATHGDKSKANELSKFLGKKLKGELHLLNERVMGYNNLK